MLRTAVLTQRGFSDAAQAWLETRKPYISERTYRDYSHHIETLGKFFSEIRLPEIDADQIREYQRMRMVRAGASLINRECSVLGQMLQRIGCWAEIEPNYQPLALPKESPHKALSAAEEMRLYRVGPTNPKWEVAFYMFVIAMNTTYGEGEIRHLRLQDIDWQNRRLRVIEGAKNEGRVRNNPCNDAAWDAVEHLAARAKRLGATEPYHYLLPFCVRTGTYDPTRPMITCRVAFKEMCAAADVRASFYDLRHSAITKLLEDSEISDETVEKLAGHVSSRMKKKYSHTRHEVLRAAVERIAPRSVKDSGNPAKYRA